MKKNKLTGENIASLSINANDINLYAKWAPKQYSIVYYDGSTVISTVPVTYGSEMNLIDGPAKPNQVFVGWYQYITVEGGSVEEVYVNDGLMPAIDKNEPGKTNFELHAKYVAAESIKIVYHDEAGNVLFEIDSNSADSSFLAYIKEILGQNHFGITD